MTASSTVHEQIGWLLEDFRLRVTGLTHAVVLSADGMVLATTAGLSTARANQLGAIASGLSGLSHGAAELFRSGPVLQIAVEMDIGFLLVTRIDDRACVATLAVREADLEQVGYEVMVLVDRVSKVLAPRLRPRAAANGTVPAAGPVAGTAADTGAADTSTAPAGEPVAGPAAAPPTEPPMEPPAGPPAEPPAGPPGGPPAGHQAAPPPYRGPSTEPGQDVAEAGS